MKRGDAELKNFFGVLGKMLLLAVLVTLVMCIVLLPFILASMDLSGGTVTITRKLSDQVASYAQIAAFIAATWFMFFIFERKKGWPLGWRQPSAGKQFAKGMLLGFVAITVTCAAIAAAGGVHFQSFSLEDPILADMFKWLILFIFVAFNEELVSRGYIQGLLRYNYGPTAAILVTSVLFALMHAINPDMWSSPLPVINLILAGIFLGLCREVSGGLWLPMGVHLTWNFFQGSIYGFHVSGQDVLAPISLQKTGSDWLSGGAFGAEGSVLATVVLILVCIWIYRKRSLLSSRSDIRIPIDRTGF
jgi:membrane protease YdiL (CAAX protease family)